jgi:hypothetical protein
MVSSVKLLNLYLREEFDRSTDSLNMTSVTLRSDQQAPPAESMAKSTTSVKKFSGMFVLRIRSYLLLPPDKQFKRRGKSNLYLEQSPRSVAIAVINDKNLI